MDAAIATLIGVGITAFVTGSVAVYAIRANNRTTTRTLRHGAARELGKISLEHKTQQLNELYGPLLLLLEENRRLAQKLREGKGDPEKWRLLDHLPEVLNNAHDKAIVDEIMEIDARVEDLIINKAGLVRSPGPPESFYIFLGHYKTLKLAIEGKERPRVAEFEYYPRKLNNDVKGAYEAIQREIDETLRRYESLAKE